MVSALSKKVTRFKPARQARAAVASLFALPVLKRVPPALVRAGTALQRRPGVDVDDHIHEVDASLRFINTPAPVVIDAGANVGRWTEAFLSRVPNPRLLIRFEPQPDCWESLEAQASPTVLLERAALSDANGSLSFFANENTEVASVYARSDFPEDVAQSISVEAFQLDDYLETRGIQSVDFLKMDIEGHEMSALAGARQSLADNRIKAVSFEFGMANVNSRTYFIDFWEFFADLGWRIYRTLPGGGLELIESYSRHLERFFTVDTFIASAVQPKG